MSQINKNHIGTKFDDFLAENLNDEIKAKAYLDAALEQFLIDSNIELYLESLKKVIKVRGGTLMMKKYNDLKNGLLSDPEVKKEYDEIDQEYKTFEIERLGETLLKAITDAIDEADLISITKEREGEESIEVNIDDL